MTKVGDFNVIFSQTLLAQEGEEIWIDFNYDNEDFKVSIVFTAQAGTSDSKIVERSLEIKAFDDHAKFVFINWNHLHPTVTLEPISFADAPNKEQSIYYSGCISKIGSSYLLHNQFMVGAHDRP